VIAAEPGPTIPDDVRLLHAGTLALAVEPAASAVERLVASEASRRLVMIDPNVRPNVIGDRDAYLARLERLFSSADIVKASAEDLEWLYPGSTGGVVAKRLLADRTSLVVLTHGAAGAEAWTATDHIRIDAPRVEIVDTVGAGDAFGAALIAALDIESDSASTFGSNLGRRRIERALGYAAAVGALQCSQSSAWAPTREDVDAFLEQQAVTPVA
jgi:fructokinase